MRLLTILITLSCLVTPASADSGGTSVRGYGSGTAGKGGFVPEAWVAAGPYLGNKAFGITIEKGLGGAAAIHLLSGRSSAFRLFDFTLLVDPRDALFMTPFIGALSGASGTGGVGKATSPLPLPSYTNLLGLSLYSQWIVLDNAAKSGLVASDGVRVTFTQGPLVVAAGSRSLFHYVPGQTAVVTINSSLNYNDVQISDDGSLGFVTGGGFHVFDLTKSPATRIAGTTFTSGNPNNLSVHPDQSRAYLPIPHRTQASVQIVDIKKGSRTFGQRIGAVAKVPFNAGDMEGSSISANGKVLVVAIMGLAGRRSLLVIDVDPSSATRDTLIRQIPVNISGFMTDVDVSPDGAFAYCCFAQLGVGSDAARILLANGLVLNHTKFSADFATDIDLDPRGRFAVIACPNSSNLVFIDLRPGTGFFKARILPPVSRARFFSVALTPDATQAVAVGQPAAGGLYSFDVLTGKILWSVSAPRGGVAIAVR